MGLASRVRMLTSTAVLLVAKLGRESTSTCWQKRWSAVGARDLAWRVVAWRL